MAISFSGRESDPQEPFVVCLVLSNFMTFNMRLGFLNNL